MVIRKRLKFSLLMLAQRLYVNRASLNWGGGIPRKSSLSLVELRINSPFKPNSEDTSIQASPGYTVRWY
jgi:hypothetical protein